MNQESSQQIMDWKKKEGGGKRNFAGEWDLTQTQTPVHPRRPVTQPRPMPRPAAELPAALRHRPTRPRGDRRRGDHARSRRDGPQDRTRPRHLPHARHRAGLAQPAHRRRRVPSRLGQRRSVVPGRRPRQVRTLDGANVDWPRLLQLHHAVQPKPKGKPTFHLVAQMTGEHGYRRVDARNALARGLSPAHSGRVGAKSMKAPPSNSG